MSLIHVVSRNQQERKTFYVDEIAGTFDLSRYVITYQDTEKSYYELFKADAGYCLHEKRKFSVVELSPISTLSVYLERLLKLGYEIFIITDDDNETAE